LHSKLEKLVSSACLINGIKNNLKENCNPEYFSELWEQKLLLLQRIMICLLIFPYLVTIK
jgi:hypothetical protein